SSCTTWTASSPRSASAIAIGVLREPGATTAWRTPQRTHSSTSVAQAVALALPIPVMAPDDRARTLGTMSAASTSDRPRVTVEIWSDVVCPWCYIGKRRFERALDEVASELDIDVRYRPYQLDPTASPGRSQPVFEAYAKKFGGPEQARRIIDRVTETAAADGLERSEERRVGSGG